eukprot:CAMPEP_0198589644 /NCGR_PEP_ID=MMETSP1462-20131121/134648_1 /TAXON_ID=1333877 /ORGANISM="Brandtodinium nutriculum, Strain RCC3387" /LENGTH=44 /DNA_ID= /DNA_START= /DNA_END= /DNA_ORIENTATION=
MMAATAEKVVVGPYDKCMSAITGMAHASELLCTRIAQREEEIEG